MATRVVFENDSLKVYVDDELRLNQPFDPRGENFNADGTPSAWASEQAARAWYDSHVKHEYESE